MEKMMLPVPRLFTAAVAAGYLGMGVRTFENHWRRGNLPAPHRIGRKLLWDRRVLDAYVDALSGFTSYDLTILRKSEPDFWKNTTLSRWDKRRNREPLI